MWRAQQGGTRSLFPLDCLRFNLAPTNFFWPENHYTFPQGSLEESTIQTQKQQNRGCRSEDLRGNSIGATAGWISTFCNVFLINTMIKGE
jgi:hypothetical protein